MHDCGNLNEAAHPNSLSRFQGPPPSRPKAPYPFADLPKARETRNLGRPAEGPKDGTDKGPLASSPSCGGSRYWAPAASHGVLKQMEPKFEHEQYATPMEYKGLRFKVLSQFAAVSLEYVVFPGFGSISRQNDEVCG